MTKRSNFNASFYNHQHYYFKILCENRHGHIYMNTFTKQLTFSFFSQFDDKTNISVQYPETV